ncbi:hypothetical protein [Streptomyces erythrochromogenes]|uniref:hypothetical protein n=1 Tax=Streptomyces erythrochromogenes TaxID=285574 RepID=UPI0037F4C2D4
MLRFNQTERHEADIAAETERLKSQMCQADPLLLACTESVASTLAPETEIPELLVNWVLGTGPDDLTFGDGSTVAMLMAATPEAARARAAVLDKWRQMGSTESRKLSDYSIQDLSTGELTLQLAQDAVSMINGLKDPNAVKVQLGSFAISGRVIAASEEGIQVRFTVKETQDFSSFAHLFTGYSKEPGIIMKALDRKGFLGVMGPKQNLVTWREELRY